MKHAPAGTVARTLARAAVLAAVCLAAAASLAVAAAPAARAAPRPPAPSAPAAPAVPDTADLAFRSAPGAPAPVALHALADTVAFGGVLPVAWDLPAGTATTAAAPPVPVGEELAPVAAARGPWWRRRGGPPAPPVPAAALKALPPAAGPRVVAQYRVYRTGPFRLVGAGGRSAVITVRGRVQDPSRLAAIRDPRAWPWFTTALVLLVLGGVAVAAAIWWWWRRRRAAAAPADWPLPEPAWIEAALDLQRLLGERRLERGEPRAFLDGLAGAARRFAAGHFGVPASDLTGRELVAACAARGWDGPRPLALARLIDLADLNRYDPAPPAADWCRGQGAELVTQMAEVRVQPRQTPVAAERLLAAQQAWTEVVTGLTRETAPDPAPWPDAGGR